MQCSGPCSPREEERLPGFVSAPLPHVVQREAWAGLGSLAKLYLVAAACSVLCFNWTEYLAAQGYPWNRNSPLEFGFGYLAAGCMVGASALSASFFQHPTPPPLVFPARELRHQGEASS